MAQEILSTQLYNNHQLATVLHDAGAKKIVIMCHGYRGNLTGPSRLYVTLARQLADKGISSLRFDQYGSGSSEGDFYDSSFDDWVTTIRSIAREYMNQGYEVAILGTSMGGAATIAAAAELPSLKAVALWVPDPNVDVFTPPKDGKIEEGGQVVSSRYWIEAHAARIPERFAQIQSPTYVVFGSEDAFVDAENQQAIQKAAQSHQMIDVLEGYGHGPWTVVQSELVLQRTREFFVDSLR